MNKTNLGQTVRLESKDTIRDNRIALKGLSYTLNNFQWSVMRPFEHQKGESLSGIERHELYSQEYF
jgi:hypothetical protein